MLRLINAGLRADSRGIRYAFEQGADHVVILNNDTTVHPTFIDHLVQAAIEHPKAGMSVPKIYYDHPTPSGPPAPYSAASLPWSICAKPGAPTMAASTNHKT